MAAAAPAALDCWGALEEDALTGVVATALGRPVTLAGFTCVPVAYQPGSPATGALLRVSGTTGDGEPWSLFLKVLHHPRHWPRIGDVPDEVRQQFLDQFPWRMELVAWAPGFADRLPAGMRVPRLYRLAELGDDRLAVWMEDVRVLDGAWDPPRFARAAHTLGGLAAAPTPSCWPPAACPSAGGCAATTARGSSSCCRSWTGTSSGPTRCWPERSTAGSGMIYEPWARGCRNCWTGWTACPRPCPTATPAPEPAGVGRRPGHLRGHRRVVPVTPGGRVRPRPAAGRPDPRRRAAGRRPARDPPAAGPGLHRRPAGGRRPGHRRGGRLRVRGQPGRAGRVHLAAVRAPGRAAHPGPWPPPSASGPP